MFVKALQSLGNDSGSEHLNESQLEKNPRWRLSSHQEPKKAKEQKELEYSPMHEPLRVSR